MALYNEVGEGLRVVGLCMPAERERERERDIYRYTHNYTHIHTCMYKLPSVSGQSHGAFLSLVGWYAVYPSTRVMSFPVPQGLLATQYHVIYPNLEVHE